MSNHCLGLVLAEPKATYDTSAMPNPWVEVLVDCPGVQGLFTYSLPPDLGVKSGDIVTVPFGKQQIGGIVITLKSSPPEDIDLAKIKPIEDIIAAGFFPTTYWQLLNQLADYYCTPLITVIRSALPPGLLGRSQRRIRLKPEVLPPGADAFCSPLAQQVLALLQNQKTGDYSIQYIQRQIRGARRGLQDLLKRGWVESYLEPPKQARPKQRKAVTLVVDAFPLDLTPRQREILEVLRRQGGELWLTELLQRCNASSSLITTLERKGCVAVQSREVLRLLQEKQPQRDSPKVLNPSQTEALERINRISGYAQILLHGVTGSGKTEVYLQAIAPLLDQGKSALVLVPEIGLTPQLTDRFRARFGNQVCVYHSALSDGERYDTWRQMLLGEPQVVIGTRSAIFVPLPTLGLIILDEEHDSSFKQTHLAPTYHARTVAQWRATLEHCPLILGSATPSLETWVETRGVGGQEGKGAEGLGSEMLFSGKSSSSSLSPPPHNSHYISLPERIQSRPLPPVEIVDMRQELKQGNRSIFSRSLQTALTQLQVQGQQGILFIPRRGYSTFVSCRSCGEVIDCPHCDVSLSYHYTHEGATQLLRCHYCNYTQHHPLDCPTCGSPYLKFFGSGTQRVTQELTRHFPQLRFIRFDGDTTRTKGAHRTLLNRFSQGEADLLVGTQMLTKGLDLAEVTLVGVVSADGLLHHSDYCAAERAFQTLTQVAGRAGRGDDPGQVIIQTYSPEHPVIQSVQTHDYEGFIPKELEQRQDLNYPPYGRLILLRLSGNNGEEVEATALSLADACGNLGSEYDILGPAPARVMRVARRYRWQILLKFSPTIPVPDLVALQELCPPSVSFNLDVDPINMD